MKGRVTSLNRFEQYVLLDHKARWGNDGECLLAAFVWLLIRLATGTATDKRSFEEAIGVLLVGFVGTTIAHTLRARKIRRRLVVRAFRMPKLAALAALAFSSVLTAVWVGGFVVQKTQAVEVQRLASLSPTELGSNLSSLRLVIEQRNPKAKLKTADLQKIATNLAQADPNAKEYWPTAISFIEFVSSYYGSKAPPPGTPGANYISYSRLIGQMVNIPPGSTVVIEGSYIEGETFTDSRIIFEGAPSELKNVRFINCVFEFRNQSHPTLFQKQAASRLLAAGIQSVSIESLGSNG